MASGINPTSNEGSQDPYSILGVDPAASFDEVQQAREKRLLEIGEDPLAKAKIEASYDALLMASLKERQLGRVSNEAVNASKKEERNFQSVGGSNGSILTRLKSFDFSNKADSERSIMPTLSLAEGYGLTIRLALGIFVLLLALISPKESIQIILSLSTLGLFISQVKRGRKALPALGWSVVLLSIGLILGGIIISGFPETSVPTTSLSRESLEALPAILLIWLGTLLLA